MLKNSYSISDMAQKLNRPIEGIQAKIMRLNLKHLPSNNNANNLPSSAEAETKNNFITQTDLEPKELLTHEQVLKILSAALQRLQQGNLGDKEVKRLKTLSTLASRYDTLLGRFERWDEIEKRLETVEARLEEVASQKQM